MNHTFKTIFAEGFTKWDDQLKTEMHSIKSPDTREEFITLLKTLRKYQNMEYFYLRIESMIAKMKEPITTKFEWSYEDEIDLLRLVEAIEKYYSCQKILQRMVKSDLIYIYDFDWDKDLNQSQKKGLTDLLNNL